MFAVVIANIKYLFNALYKIISHTTIQAHHYNYKSMRYSYSVTFSTQL